MKYKFEHICFVAKGYLQLLLKMIEFTHTAYKFMYTVWAVVFTTGSRPGSYSQPFEFGTQRKTTPTLNSRVEITQV